MKKNKEIINNFLDYIKFEKNYSELTIKSYKQDLESFVSFLSNKEITSIKNEDIKEYINYISKKGLSSSSISRNISSIKSLYKY
ncbi:MAG: site-specific integrase, partial [Bacilli bacterium]